MERTELQTKTLYLVDFMEELSLEYLRLLEVYLKIAKLQMNDKVVHLYLINILVSSTLKEEVVSINSRIRTSQWQMSGT